MPKAPNTVPGPLTAAVAEILRIERARLMLNDSALATLASVDRTAVGRILRGVKVPDVEVLGRLCRALQTTASSVLEAAEADTAHEPLVAPAAR